MGTRGDDEARDEAATEAAIEALVRAWECPVCHATASADEDTMEWVEGHAIDCAALRADVSASPSGWFAKLCQQDVGADERAHREAHRRSGTNRPYYSGD